MQYVRYGCYLSVLAALAAGLAGCGGKSGGSADGGIASVCGNGRIEGVEECDMTFTGLTTTLGSAHVTPINTTGVQCVLAAWTSAAATASVVCFNSAGTLTNSAYAISFMK